MALPQGRNRVCGRWHQRALLRWHVGWGRRRGFVGHEPESRAPARGRDQLVEQTQLSSCVLEPTILAAQRRAPGAVDHGGTAHVQPAQEHHRAQVIACRAGAEQDDLDQEPGCFAGRGKKSPCPNAEPPLERMREARDPTPEPMRHPRDRCEQPAGGAPDGRPPHLPRRSGRPAPALERQAGVVAGEAATWAETERARERAAAAKARSKVHGSWYATPAQVPPSAARHG
jgi:hypothetical protein